MKAKSKSMRATSIRFCLVALVVLSTRITASSQPVSPTNTFLLVTLGNSVPTNAPVVTNSRPTLVATNPIVPIIVNDMPLGTVIENLTRCADINHLIDSRLLKWWAFPDSDGNLTHEPIIVKFRSTNLTVKQALQRILQEHNLALLEDPVTTVARITYKNQVVQPIDVSLLGSDTNLIPVIQFHDVPITTGLENLARIAGINYSLDPKIGYGLPDKNGQIKEEPLLSLHWERITAKQGFIAICENYGFVAVKSSTPDCVKITQSN